MKRKTKKTVKILLILMRKTLIHLDQGLKARKMTHGLVSEQVCYVAAFTMVKQAKLRSVETH